MLELFLDEIYGRLSDEKESENMPKKIKEVKSHKALDSITIIG